MTFDKSFYTIQEAAELLRVHENTFYHLIRSRAIDYYKVGRQIRIPAEELEKLRVPA